MDEAVDAFEDAVGDLGGEPAEDAVPVALDGSGCLDDGLEAALTQLGQLWGGDSPPLINAFLRVGNPADGIDDDVPR